MFKFSERDWNAIGNTTMGGLMILIIVFLSSVVVNTWGLQGRMDTQFAKAAANTEAHFAAMHSRVGRLAMRGGFAARSAGLRPDFGDAVPHDATPAAEDRRAAVVPAREFVKFTPLPKEKLVTLPVNDWPAVLEREVAGVADDAGPGDMRQSLRDVVIPLRRDGVISAKTAFGLVEPAAAEIPPLGGMP